MAIAIDKSYPIYAVGMVVVGCGITLALPTLTMAITAALPREQAGVAGGLQSTTRELGSALGVAVIGTLLNARFVHQLPEPASGQHTSHTVAQALRTMPARRHEVITAYTSAADTALKAVAVIVLTAGALIITELTWPSRDRV